MASVLKSRVVFKVKWSTLCVSDFYFEKFNMRKPQLLYDKREVNKEKNKRSCERQWCVAIYLNVYLQQHAEVDSYSQI